MKRILVNDRFNGDDVQTGYIEMNTRSDRVYQRQRRHHRGSRYLLWLVKTVEQCTTWIVYQVLPDWFLPLRFTLQTFSSDRFKSRFSVRVVKLINTNMFKVS